jgi:hypothetical protein
MLAYTTLLNQPSVLDLHEKVGSERWYDKIPPKIPGLTVPLTCPLVYLFSPLFNLKAQVQAVRKLYSTYTFLPSFGGSHALFIDYALKDLYGEQEF